MKKTTPKSDVYWQKNPKQFSDLYTQTPWIISPSTVVARFLSDRSTLLLSLIPAHPSHLLDLGCGSGPHIKLLLQSAKQIVGVDYSQHMLDIAKKNLGQQKKHTWKLIQADAANLPMPSNSFDCIISMGLLDYVPSPLLVLKECRRVITKDGVLIVSMPKKPSLFSLLRNPAGDWLKRVLFHLPPIDNAVTKTELISLIHAAGFHMITIGSVWSAMWMIKVKPIHHDSLTNRKSSIK